MTLHATPFETVWTVVMTVGWLVGVYLSWGAVERWWTLNNNDLNGETRAVALGWATMNVAVSAMVALLALLAAWTLFLPSQGADTSRMYITLTVLTVVAWGLVGAQLLSLRAVIKVNAYLDAHAEALERDEHGA